MIFEVSPDHIARLNDADLRTLLAHLCELEVHNVSQSTAGVTWGGHQNAPDGGIDVRVELDETAVISGYVPRPSTGIQVKATDMNRAAILKEMAPKGKLLASIRELGEKNGAYIIASSKSSLSDTALTNRQNAMVEALVGVESAESLHVDFYDQRRLATWTNQHPGLVTWVLKKTGNTISHWRPFDDWSSSPTSTDAEYFADDKVRLLRARISEDNSLGTTDGINTIRAILAEPKGIVRLVGLSGVGKTRLAQALFDNRVGEGALEPTTAIYTDISDSPDPVPQDLLSGLIIRGQRAVLIIDNCGIELHKKLVARINQSSGLVSLLTIEYDIQDDEPEYTDVFKLEAVTEDLIQKILEVRFPALSGPDRRKIAEFSDGNARIAFALANTAENGESLANMRDSELFDRLFHQNKSIDINLLDAAKACSLVYSYDGETLNGEDAELPLLANLVGQTAHQLYRHSAELFRRQLVQKRSKWRAVLPHALAHHLAKVALEDVPFQIIEENIINGGSPRLLKSFSRRIGFLHDTEHAKKLVQNWLSVDGLLGKVGNLNKLGEALLGNVAPIDPELTLSYLEKAANSDSDFFTTENTNRAVIIGILRSLAYEADLFERSVSLLVRFGHHEEVAGNNTHNAREVTKSLFYIYLSGTHASPAQRVAVIRKLLESNDPLDHELGLSALGAMLQTEHFTSHYGFEFGARPRDYGLHPENSDDISDWFNAVLDIVTEFGAGNRPYSQEVQKRFAAKIRWLSRHPLLLDKTIAVAGALSLDEGWPLGWVGVRSAIKARRENMPAEELQKLQKLAERLAPKKLSDMVRSYALTKEWGVLDIADLDEDEENKPVEARQKIMEICVDLGEKLAKSPDDLNALLPEILASKANKVWSLGKGLAEGCTSPAQLWDVIVEATYDDLHSGNNTGLLGGFISSIATIDIEAAENFLDTALDDERLHDTFVYLQINAGLTARGIERLKRALKIETIPVYSFRNLAFGGVTGQIPDGDLAIILKLLSDKKDGLGTALDIFSMFLHGLSSKQKPANDAQKAIGRMLLSKLSFEDRSEQEDYELGEIAKACLKETNSEPVARSVCEKFLMAIKEHHVYAGKFKRFMSAISLTHPIVLLDVFVGQSDNGYFGLRGIFSDLREDRDDPLDNISDITLLEWAQVDPEARFPKLAEAIRYFIQAGQDTPAQWTTAASKLIQLAPNPVAVLDIFLDRFAPMGWSGSKADIMQQRIPLLEELLKKKNTKVVEWASAKLPVYVGVVAQEREREAEWDRDRDEKFEW